MERVERRVEHMRLYNTQRADMIINSIIKMFESPTIFQELYLPLWLYGYLSTRFSSLTTHDIDKDNKGIKIINKIKIYWLKYIMGRENAEASQFLPGFIQALETSSPDSIWEHGQILIIS